MLRYSPVTFAPSRVGCGPSTGSAGLRCAQSQSRLPAELRSPTRSVETRRRPRGPAGALHIASNKTRKALAGAARKEKAAPAGTTRAPHCPETTRSKVQKTRGVRTSTAADGTATHTAAVPPACVQTNTCAIHGTAVPIPSPTTPLQIPVPPLSPGGEDTIRSDLYERR